jgi:hypothetical protein
VEIIRMRGVEIRPLGGVAPIARTSLAWQKANASPLVAAFVDSARDAARRFGSAAPRKKSR